MQRPTTFLEAFIQQVQPSMTEESECLRGYRENKDTFAKVWSDFEAGMVNVVALGVQVAILFQNCNISLLKVHVTTAFSDRGVAGVLYRVWTESKRLWEAVVYSDWSD